MSTTDTKLSDTQSSSELHAEDLVLLQEEIDIQQKNAKVAPYYLNYPMVYVFIYMLMVFTNHIMIHQYNTSECKGPRAYLVGQIVLGYIIMFLYAWTFIGPIPFSSFTYYLAIWAIHSVLAVFWFIMGIVWEVRQKACREDAPGVFWLTFIELLIFALEVLLLILSFIFSAIDDCMERVKEEDAIIKDFEEQLEDDKREIEEKEEEKEKQAIKPVFAFDVIENKQPVPGRNAKASAKTIKSVNGSATRSRAVQSIPTKRSVGDERKTQSVTKRSSSGEHKSSSGKSGGKGGKSSSEEEKKGSSTTSSDKGEKVFGDAKKSSSESKSGSKSESKTDSKSESKSTSSDERKKDSSSDSHSDSHNRKSSSSENKSNERKSESSTTSSSSKGGANHSTSGSNTGSGSGSGSGKNEGNKAKSHSSESEGERKSGSSSSGKEDRKSESSGSRSEEEKNDDQPPPPPPEEEEEE